MVYNIQKGMKQKSIDEENTRIFARLIQTTPTIKRNEWIRKNIEATKYKENINRSRCNFFIYLDAQPDYSVEAYKLLNNRTGKNYHLKMLKHNIGTSQSKVSLCQSNSLSNVKMRV